MILRIKRSLTVLNCQILVCSRSEDRVVELGIHKVLAWMGDGLSRLRCLVGLEGSRIKFVSLSRTLKDPGCYLVSTKIY